MNPKRNRRRGAEVENQIVNMLREAGVAAEKISRTGYTGPDMLIRDEFLGECKLRKGGWKLILDWLAPVHILFLRQHGVREPIVVMRFGLFIRLLGGRNGQ